MSKIAILFAIIFKTIRFFKESAFKGSNNKDIENSSGIDKTVRELFKCKKVTYILNIRSIRKPNFLNPNAKKIFNYLRQTFIKALIF